MSTVYMLADLKACQSRGALAILLGIPAKELSYTLYMLADANKYTPFCISKKNGGTRNILAPTAKLKWIQNSLLQVLYECEDDIQISSDKSKNLQFGFRRGINIYDNAYAHRKKRFVFNIDIADFFDQFNFGRVRGFFIKDRDFLLNNDVATVIAQIACFDNKLPQGSPCSPHIANLVSQFFDIRMTRFLRPLRCTYTRYADDITISTNERNFPAEIAVTDNEDPQGWKLSDALTDIFARSGFPINQAKVRMSLAESRQLVTGLVVNQRPNVTREFYLQTRSMCDRLFKTGSIEITPICDGFGNNCETDSDEGSVIKTSPISVLEGRLSHIDHIREKWDKRSIQEKQDVPTQFWKTLKDFYLFKYFFGNTKPTIVTEGPSDILYLKSAIRQLAGMFPNLLDADGKILVSFFNFDGRASKVLGLTGGSGNIKRFIYLYNERKKQFNSNLMNSPTLILVDKDTGGADAIHMINGIYKKKITLADPTMMHAVDGHLFLLKTPHATGGIHSCVEDLLPAAVKNITLNGKTFSSAKTFDTAKHFGKIPLSHYVSANAGSIDFAGFSGLLGALDTAIKLAKN